MDKEDVVHIHSGQLLNHTNALRNRWLHVSVRVYHGNFKTSTGKLRACHIGSGLAASFYYEIITFSSKTLSPNPIYDWNISLLYLIWFGVTDSKLGKTVQNHSVFFPQVKILINLNAQWKPEVDASNHHTFLCANCIKQFSSWPQLFGKNYKAL